MSTDLICPDCGGIIGGDSSNPGRACSCWSNKAKIAELEDGPSTSNDTVSDKPVGPAAKVCCQCGKELNGQKRLRDSRGYWCYACHKLDQEATKPKGVRCADCGRKVPEAALADYNGSMICGSCRNDRKEQAKKDRITNGIKTDSYDQLAKQKLLWMLVIAAVLVGIIVLRHFKIIGS
jgi:hypothetical protein